jgi:uncharacterized protein (TIGR02217 family)
MIAFHDTLFPLDIALKSAGGPERRTEIVSFSSGREERNARWAHSRRRYDAGYGIRTLTALQSVVAFFEERRGRLQAFARATGSIRPRTYQAKRFRSAIRASASVTAQPPRFN